MESISILTAQPPCIFPFLIWCILILGPIAGSWHKYQVRYRHPLPWVLPSEPTRTWKQRCTRLFEGLYAHTVVTVFFRFFSIEIISVASINIGLLEIQNCWNANHSVWKQSSVRYIFIFTRKFRTKSSTTSGRCVTEAFGRVSFLACEIMQTSFTTGLSYDPHSCYINVFPSDLLVFHIPQCYKNV